MVTLSRDLRTTAFDHAGSGEVSFPSGTKVHVVKIHGNIATCVIGSSIYSMSFSVPTDALIRRAAEEDTPAEEKAEQFEKAEEEIGEETEIVPHKKFIEPGLTVKEPGALTPEEETGILAPEGAPQAKEPEEIIEILEELPEAAIREAMPAEYVGTLKVELPQWFRDYSPAMFTYPDSGPHKDRFVGVENTKMRAGWMMYDMMNPQQPQSIGTVKGIVEMADSILKQETGS